MKGNHLSLSDILARRWRTFLVTGSALSSMFALGYVLQPVQYETFGVFRPQTTEQRSIKRAPQADLLKPLSFLDKYLNQLFLKSSDISPEARLIKDNDNLQTAIETLRILDHEGNPASPRSLHQRISLSSSDQGETVRIGLHDPDPAIAQKIVNQLMASYVQRFSVQDATQSVNFQSLIQPQLVQSQTLIRQTEQALYQIQLGSAPTPFAPTEKAGDQTLDLQSMRINAQQQVAPIDNELSVLQTEANTALSDRKLLLQDVITLTQVRQEVLDLLLTTLDQPRDSEQISSLLNTLESKNLDLKKYLTVTQTSYNNFLKEQTSNWIINAQNQSPVAIVAEASTPTQGDRPHKQWFLGLGLLTAVLGGTLASWVKEQKDDSLLSLSDIYAHTQLPIFGVIPHFSKKQQQFQLITRKDGGSYPDVLSAATTAATIWESFEQASFGKVPQVLAFTSTLRQEGTSLTTANLAYFFAQQGKKVLIIDANLYHPHQHVLWARSQSLGLCDCIAGEAQLGKTLQRLHPNLDLLQAGYTHKNKDILLNSPAMSLLIQDFRSRYDHVLIDTPAFDVSVHSYLLANSADATVILVKPDHINHEQVLKLRETAQRSDTKFWGMIINDSSQNPSSNKIKSLIQSSQWDANLRLQYQGQSNQQELSTFAAINPQTTSTDDGQALPYLNPHTSQTEQENYLYNLPLEELHKLVHALWESWSHDMELVLEQEEEVVQQSRTVSELQERIDQGSAYNKLTSEIQLKEEQEKLDLLADTFMGQRPRLMELQEDLRLYQEVLLARTDAEQIPMQFLQ